MEKEYNDFLMPQDFEQMAKAYSQALKKRGFVFVRLEEEALGFLVDEVYVILQKIIACLIKLEKRADSALLKKKIELSESLLSEKFILSKKTKFKYVGNEASAFLNLIALENLLVVKLLELAVKSEEIEICHQIASNVCGVFYKSFNTEGFEETIY